MKISKVADLFVEFLEIYSENRLTDIKNFIANASLEGVCEDLMNDCIEGCLRHLPTINKMIDSFIKSLVDKKGSSFLPKEDKIMNILRALTYLLVFEINKIGLDQYEKVAIHYLNSHVQEFLKFLTNPSNISGTLQNSWLKFYDQLFVENTFVAPMLRLAPDLAEMIQKMDLILQRKKPKSKSKSITIPEPFIFSEARGEVYLKTKCEPVVSLSKNGVHKRVKYKTNKSEIIRRSENKKTMNSIEFDRQARYLQPIKSEKTLQKIAQLLEEKEKELQFDKPKASRPPPSFQLDMPVKQNTTTVLREAALVKKKIEQQMKKVEELEQGTIMGAQMSKRLEEFRDEEEKKLIATLDQNRLKGLLSREEALLAKQTTIREKKKQVQLLKDELEESARECHQQKQEEQERSKFIVQQVMQSETRTKEAVKKVVDEKRDIATKMQDELQELKSKFKDESDEALKHRRCLVNEIRALKLESAQLRQTSSRRLQDMSLAQLHEHLELLKKWKKETEEEKRAQIKEEKKMKEKQLRDVKEFIGKYRQREAQGHGKDEQKKTLITQVRQKNADVEYLTKKLEETRALRMKLTTQVACGTDVKSKNSSAAKQKTNI